MTRLLKVLFVCTIVVLAIAPPTPTAADGFLAEVSFAPQEAQFFELVDNTLNLSESELAMLEQNGFVLTERLAFQDYLHAYAWIYYYDLPALVTTDAMLHAVHETFSDLLMRAEEQMLAPMLRQLLERTREQLQEANCQGRIADACRDLDLYLAVPLALLNFTGYPIEEGDTAPYVQLALEANAFSEVTLFGTPRPIDFTLFRPRSHYTESFELSKYFMAMMWLAQLDFRLLHYDDLGQPVLNPSQIAAAALLRDAMAADETRALWQQLDTLFTALVGRSDNTTLPELEQFLADAGIQSPADVFDADAQQLLTLLTTNDYGQQRITNQLLSVQRGVAEPLPRPVSFMLLGQRFTVDSYLMSNLVYDRLIVDGMKVERAFPQPLEIMYVLGNDRAGTHLQDEIARYGHQDNLDTLRESVNGFDAAFWSQSTYNQWLTMLRTLNIPTTTSDYPQAMRTEAWADKSLQTQLASWAQLRHDVLLYAEQSMTVQPLCEYPAGYVEPYPDFYAALGEYARAGQTLFDGIDTTVNPNAQGFKAETLTYFVRLEQAAARLQTMAEKELRLEPFTAEEEQFLRDIVLRRGVESESRGCYAVSVEVWSGWYAELFPWDDDTPALIADVHTNPAAELAPPGVLHVGTGPASAMIFVVDTDEGPTMYVGPAFTYYEFVEEGLPPSRLTDGDWRNRLHSEPHPSGPSWTASFRLPAALSEIEVLSLPAPE